MAPADLLMPLEGQRQETLKCLDRLSDADLDRVFNGSGRTVRRIFAHLASAELGQAFLIRLAAEGEVVHMSTEDRDQFNQAEMDKADGWDCHRLRAELEEARATLREAFTELEEEDLDRAIRWPEWPARTIRSSIPYMLEHEDSHLDEVRRTVDR
jgi:uncharacterized damage-inducible protein DinB